MFGKAQTQQTLLDEFHLLIRKPHYPYSSFVHKYLYEHCSSFQSLIVVNGLTYMKHPPTTIDIYEQSDMRIAEKLCKPIMNILYRVKELLKLYNIDSIKVLGTLCNKINEHSLQDEVYKVLTDCEHLTDKIF